MITKLLYIVALILFVPCETSNIKVDWADTLGGDYSFVKKWDYSMPIYRNDFGQLVCDGLCPEETYSMRDDSGKILPDYINQYYQLIDTTHVHHSIESETNSYEWVEAKFAHANRMGKDTVQVYTLCDISTHSSLNIIIVKDICLPFIELNSITPSGLQHFACKDGYMKIDKCLWQKDTIKAEFNFVFEDGLWWRGRILAPIQSE